MYLFYLAISWASMVIRSCLGIASYPDKMNCRAALLSLDLSFLPVFVVRSDPRWLDMKDLLALASCFTKSSCTIHTWNCYQLADSKSCYKIQGSCWSQAGCGVFDGFILTLDILVSKTKNGLIGDIAKNE